MNKAIYIRTSTKEQTPELQLKDISTLTKIEECLNYSDKQSAWQDFKERDEFNKLKTLIAKNQVTDLYVWDLDRIYRNRKKLVEFFAYCKVYNTKIHSYRQQWLEQLLAMPEPFNEIMYNLMLQIMGWLAEEESNKKSERIKNAVVTKEGKKTKSYKGNNWGRKNLPKQTIDKVLELSSQGFSVRKIAEQVKTTDKNNNMKNISKSVVHKIVSENLKENDSFSDSP